MEPNTIVLKRSNTTASINTQNAQLFSLVRGRTEVMWRGGAPESERPKTGWQNSEFVMFPIIGAARGDKVGLDGQVFNMTQHGLSRYLPWEIECTGQSIFMQQEYRSGQEVIGKQGQILTFPRSFTLTKEYSINEAGILSFSIEVKNESDLTLPYSIGWHPAFITPNGIQQLKFWHASGSPDHRLSTSLSTIREMDRNVFTLTHNNRVEYETSEFTLSLVHNFGKTQIWDKGEGLVALEPITSFSTRHLSTEEFPRLDAISALKKLQRGQKDRYVTEIAIQN